MTLTQFLNSRGFHQFDEGYSQEVPEQVEDLINLTNKPNIKVMEIGFNAGHSAEVFLKNNEDLKLTSFDIGIHNYIIASKEYIDTTYPNRHTLIFGDSRTTVVNYIKNNKGAKFDIIFIDGGHDYEIAKSDLENCLKLAHKDTLIIMDDTMFTSEWQEEWNIGPTTAWKDLLNSNKIIELGKKEYSVGRGMAWGNILT